MNTSHSTAGYAGALFIGAGAILTSLLIADFEQHKTIIISTLLASTFLVMLGWELLGKSAGNSGLFGEPARRLRGSAAHLLRSVLWRYAAIIAPWLAMNFLLQHHYYFQGDEFQSTRLIFSGITLTILTLGIPHIFMTLRLRGDRKFEYNDYGILLLLLGRATYRAARRRPCTHILRNRRSRKIALTWLVTFFFLPLMLRFQDTELSAMRPHMIALFNMSDANSFYQQFAIFYHAMFHLIFVIDTGLAVIAYTVSSRWLDNRVKSVDPTTSGWIVALICYPPLNYAFTDQLIGYNHFSTQPVITSDIIQMIAWTLILLLFSIYVWATAALGFKFSNLCNRGIVSSGPYRLLRHPAYTCKNVAWWLSNSYVLSSIPASLALLAGNGIYILRALTEERHLKADPAYRTYCERIRGRFLPRRKKQHQADAP